MRAWLSMTPTDVVTWKRSYPGPSAHVFVDGVEFIVKQATWRQLTRRGPFQYIGGDFEDADAVVLGLLGRTLLTRRDVFALRKSLGVDDESILTF